MTICEWDRAIESWLCALRAAGRRPKTIKLRRYQLGRVATGVAPLEPWGVTTLALSDWLGVQQWDTETRRSWRSALCSFYSWAHGVGLVAVDPARQLATIHESEPNPRPVPEDVYRLALSHAPDERVRLMLRLAAELGMRRGEVAEVHTTDLEETIDGWDLVVHGKGGKIRRVPIEPGLRLAIRRHRPSAGWVFPGAVNGHVSADWTGKLVARALPGIWTCHKLRHRFATVAHGAERDLWLVGELLGHANPNTTRRYVPVRRDALRRAVAAVAAAG